MADFWIKRPGKGRRSFSILRREAGQAAVVAHPRVALVNKLVRAGTLDHAQAARDLATIVEDLRRRERPDGEAPEPANVSLAADYWSEAYGNRTHITEDSRRSAKDALNRAVEALGGAAVTSAPIAALQRALDRWPKSRRMVAVSINALLKFVGRRERVFCGVGLRPEVRWLDTEELARLLPALPTDEHRLVVTVAFATGCRLGEVFGLTQQTLSGSVFVDRQLTSKLKTTVTKNKKERTATVLPAYLPAVRQWLSVGRADRERLRTESWARVVARASEKALGRRLVFHDLRHSYAIWWARRGAKLRAVAALIGDSQAVTERYYSRHFIDDEDEKALLALAKRA